MRVRDRGTLVPTPTQLPIHCASLQSFRGKYSSTAFDVVLLTLHLFASESVTYVFVQIAKGLFQSHSHFMDDDDDVEAE